MRFFLVLTICLYALHAETNTTEANVTDTNTTEINKTKSTQAESNATKIKKTDYSKYYQIRRGRSAQKKLFGEWIKVPKGERKDPYGSEVVKQIFSEIEEAGDISFIGIVNIKKLKINAFTREDTYRTITYVADIQKSFIPKNRKGEIEFELVLESDETFNPENSRKIFVALVDEGYRYTLDQFMVFPVQWRMIQKIEGMKLDEKVEKLLAQEVKLGYSIENISKETINQTMIIDGEYADLMLSYATKTLDKRGYDFPSRKRFVKKVRDIFEIELTEDIQVNVDSCTIDDDNKTKYTSHSIDPERIIFYKENKFIMLADRFPMLIDYRDYADLNNTDPNKKDIYSDDKNQTYIVTTWKDIYKQHVPKNKMNVIVKYNKYLFNGEDEHLGWLMRHDPDLMEDLVLKYGYVKNSQLIKKIIQSREINNAISLDGLLYFNSCKKDPIIELVYSKKEKEERSKRRKNFFIIDKTFKFIEKELGKTKYMDINNNMYLKELTRIYKDIDNRRDITYLQQEEIKDRIKKVLDKHTEPIVVKYKIRASKYSF